jgi:hypothetical protein
VSSHIVFAILTSSEGLIQYSACTAGPGRNYRVSGYADPVCHYRVAFWLRASSLPYGFPPAAGPSGCSLSRRMTGLPNRALIPEDFDREMARAVRAKRVLSIVGVDIDSFKNQ